MVGDALQKRQGGVVGLYEHLAGSVGAPACASRHLFEHIEGAFGRAEVGEVDYCVGVQDHDRRHVAEIEALGDHLCADEHIGLVRREFVDDVFVAVFVACGVEVHAQLPCAGEVLLDVVLDALGAVSGNVDAGGFAHGADFRHLGGGAAVVTFEAVGGAVVGH